MHDSNKLYSYDVPRTFKYRKLPREGLTKTQAIKKNVRKTTTLSGFVFFSGSANCVTRSEHTLFGIRNKLLVFFSPAKIIRTSRQEFRRLEQIESFDTIKGVYQEYCPRGNTVFTYYLLLLEQIIVERNRRIIGVEWRNYTRREEHCMWL